MKRRADCPHSGSAVKRAGKILRLQPSDWGANGIDVDRWMDALDVMNDWRAAHAYALNSAQMGLRSRLQTVGRAGSVSQRLKRRWSIIQKLQREPTMQLNTIQDIAGCRAVLPTVDAVYAVRDQWFKTGKNLIRRENDYIASPRPTGYRGIHLITTYDDLQVEVQLRTATQHAWSVAVEDISGAHNYDLKNGQGPTELQAMFKATADILAEVEATGYAPAGVTGQIMQALTMLRDDHSSDGELGE